MATLPHGFITGKITKTVLAYTESIGGKALAASLAERASASSKTPVHLMTDAEAPIPMDAAEALYPLVVDALGDADAIYQAGLFSRNMNAVGIFVFGMVKLLGGVRLVFQKTADIAPRFANTGTMTCTSTTANSATLEFVMYPDLRCTTYGCDYRRGLLAATPLAFGHKVPAHIDHPQCQARGAPKDVYDIRW